MTEPTKEKGIKEVDVFVQDNDLIFQLREKGNGATWDCKVFSQLMPFGVREGAFLKSFTATYVPKSNQVKLDQEIKTLKEQLAVVFQLIRRIKNACSPSDIMNCEQDLEKFLEKQDKENKDEK